jgi:uncharacterized membrane protein YhaH (DUF805 family)
MIDHMFAPLRNYATFQGRARRADFWWFVLFYIVAVIVLSMIGQAIGGPAQFLVVLFYLAVIVPYIAAGVRRMHDTNRSGWWLLVPIANIIFAASPGTVGDNRFGPDPKAGA